MARSGAGGMDLGESQALFDRVIGYIHDALPDPPVSANATLSALPDPVTYGRGGPDRFSRLPDALLRDIVSRLPIKDAARTAVLSRRWRPVWLSAPLVLIDTHLIPFGDDEIPSHVDGADSRAVAAAVSRILAAHPGPLRYVRVTCCHLDEHRPQVARWLQQLALKGVQELFLINRPWPLLLHDHIPATIFSMPALTCLYLALFRFPDTAVLPRGAAFPCLRELGLCGVMIESRDIEFVLARSPVLDVLNFEGHILPLRLRLVSRSLRCVQIQSSNIESVTVVDTPRLERLLMSSHMKEFNKIKVGHAPALRFFGCFETGKDQLQIGNTIIKSGTPVSPSTMLPSVKTLALSVQFGVRNDAKMLPSLLKCFPNLDHLRIESKKAPESTGRLTLKFWQESGAIECVKSHITRLSFCHFRGDRSEVAFLKFIVETAEKLEGMVIVFATGYYSSMAEAKAKVEALFTGRRGAQHCKLVVCESGLSGGGTPWDFQSGSDFSCEDPFSCFRGCRTARLIQWSI